MSNAFELLLRHPQLLTAETLILTPTAQVPAGWPALVRQTGAQIISWDYLTFQALQSLGEQVQFGLPQPAQVQAAKHIILVWPKAKPQAQALLQLMATSQAQCWAVGDNDSGGKSIGKSVQPLGQAHKHDAARHCSLWQLELNAQTSFNWLKFAQSFQHQTYSYLTLPGVFSHGKLDTGTALLLEYLPAPTTGKLLDLGCGSGVIGLSMKAQSPKLELTLADVDAFALQSARLNSARLGLEVHIIASDGLAEITERFDYIFTNPPFHQGKDTNYQFAQVLFAKASAHLVPQGQLWLVANTHLPYEDWAREHFTNVELMAQARGFKLLCLS